MASSVSAVARSSLPYGRFQAMTLVGLRLLIGWHFLYEGLAKLTNPYWTSAGYLAEAGWVLEEQLLRLASNPTAVTVIDSLNAWGLTLIGLGLLVGLFTRTAILAGVLLLAMYYVVAPPFPGLAYSMPAEGSYLIVNKVLIELAALLVLLAFPTARVWGLDQLVGRWRTARRRPKRAAPEPQPREPVHA